MKKKKPWLSFLVITLALSVAFSFVAISHLLIKTGNENPHGNIDISASDNDDNNNSNAESTVSQSVNAKPHEPSAKPDESRPEIDLFGGKGEVYHKEIQVFYAKYSKDGKITVKSDFGDKVVAPGTENSYDLYVRNVGKVPISYVLEAESRITADVNGEQTEIPIEASFYTPHGTYLLGGEENLDNLGKLDGAKDSSDLSPENQAKYTLCWSWPFDGDDEIDTLLGNLAAEGEELVVKVAFNVTASYDPDAAGGMPITGNTSSVGLWVAVFVISAFTLIILLFLRKKENDEEKSETRKESKK